MRGAVPLSVALHAGILGAVLLAGFVPSQSAEAESVAIDIVTLEVAVVTQPSTVPSEAVETLVSAGAESAAPETLVADLAEPLAPLLPPVETAQPVAAVALQPVETEDLISAKILVASALAAPDLQSLAPQSVAPEAIEVTRAAAVPAEPAEIDTIEVASIAPRDEVLTELEVAPVPLPRPIRQQAERKPEPTEKPAEHADSQAKKAAAGGKGKKAEGGSGASSKYPGQVQVRVSRATRYPASAKGSNGEAHVTFTVAANGGISGIKLSRSSGNAALDDAALAAVERAAPFPPIPEDAGRSSWTFTVPVAFRK